ncbi:MAG TPA: ATP-binding protein [Mobilitalea sp.]|nr:ATP-binding protein [Mobilitalea sp.]
MKRSMRFKLTFLLTVLIVLTIFLTWFINRTFLSDFYLHTKVGTLDDVYEQIREIYEENTEEVFLSEDDTLRMERISSNKDVNIYVLMFFDRSIRFNYPEPKNVIERERLISEFSSLDTKDNELIKKTNDYEIARVYDDRLDVNFIILAGTLDGNKAVYLRANYESIQESVNIANQFLAYIGMFAVVIGITVMLIISKRFTKPIHELAKIAEKMSGLDFEVNYKVNSKDEIGELGNSINLLSDKLKTTISELKTANNELLTDIQHKTEIDEMRKEFLSNVSHELKTPISLIQGYAEGLKENVNEDTESRDFYCEVIMDEASKMNKMVKKLLSLNELESGINQVNFERFDLVALIKSVLNSTEILFQQKEVQVRFDAPEQIFVWADEYLVEQVLTNYLSNALNYVSGANIIEIKLIQHGDVIRTAVFNTGENIPEEDMDKLWIKFYKVDKARTREYGGSGIGLSIVKAIMNSLNRECGVVNHPSGVEFWFELDIKC